MTEDRETSNHPDPHGTKKLSVITGGKTKAPTGANKGGKKHKGATDITTGLTVKQEAFAQAIMAGENYTDAYRQAYNAEGMADGTVWSEACRLVAHHKVSARLDQLRAQKEAEQRAMRVSLSQFVIDGFKEMTRPRLLHPDSYDEHGNPAPMVEDIPPAVRTRNLELIGKHLGLFVDRVETTDTTDRTAEEIEAALRARLGLS